MTNKLELYRCEICGNIVQVLVEGAGALVCCGKEMILQEIQHDNNEIGEKHNPIFEEIDGKKIVSVKKHPMINEHYIQFIQTQTKDKNEIYTKYFYPNQSAEVEITQSPENINALEYCNIHHLWGTQF